MQAAAAAAPGAAAPVAVPVPVTPPRAATGKPIDLSALRAFDATLTLETSAVAVASLKVTYADMQASLQNGLFKIAKLTGQFYGGAVDFDGTIDATKDVLALDLQGSLQGIYLGEMLRGTAGTNTFGNQDLMISVDGKISAVHENESVYIPIGGVHRLANPGKIPLELVEVQVGSYLGEDDIVRMDDVYGR